MDQVDSLLDLSQKFSGLGYRCRWLQKGPKRTQTGDIEVDTGGQTDANAKSEAQPASSNASANPGGF